MPPEREQTGVRRLEIRLDAQHQQYVAALMDGYGYKTPQTAMKACITAKFEDMNAGGVGAKAVADHQRRMAAKAAAARC